MTKRRGERGDRLTRSLLAECPEGRSACLVLRASCAAVGNSSVSSPSSGVATTQFTLSRRWGRLTGDETISSAVRWTPSTDCLCRAIHCSRPRSVRGASRTVISPPLPPIPASLAVCFRPRLTGVVRLDAACQLFLLGICGWSSLVLCLGVSHDMDPLGCRAGLCHSSFSLKRSMGSER